MRRLFILTSLVYLFLPIYSTAQSQHVNDRARLEKLEGITHYGMRIDEIVKRYSKDKATLTIVYSAKLSDDNMDNYVKRFYDEFLKQAEAWLNRHKLPANQVSIVISNCKFCKIGFCLKKGVKQIRLESSFNGSRHGEVTMTHAEILDDAKFAVIARSAVITLLE